MTTITLLGNEMTVDLTVTTIKLFGNGFNHFELRENKSLIAAGTFKAGEKDVLLDMIPQGNIEFLGMTKETVKESTSKKLKFVRDNMSFKTR